MGFMPIFFLTLFSNTVRGHSPEPHTTLPIIVHMGIHTYQGSLVGIIRNAAMFKNIMQECTRTVAIRINL